MGLFKEYFDKKYIPNILTVSRGPTAGLLIWGALAEWPIWLLIVIFNIGAITDYLDGHLSRRFKAQTDFGKIFDPVFDKFLLWGAYISVWFLGGNVLLFCLIVLVIIRELATDGFKGYLYHRGIVVSALPMAKTKTVMQMIMINAVYLFFAVDWLLLWWLTLITALLAIVFAYASGWQYFKLFWKQFSLENHPGAVFAASFALVGFWPLGSSVSVVLIVAGFLLILKWLLSFMVLNLSLLVLCLLLWCFFRNISRKLQSVRYWQGNWIVADLVLGVLVVLIPFLVNVSWDWSMFFPGLTFVLLYAAVRTYLPFFYENYYSYKSYIADDLMVGLLALALSFFLKSMYFL